MGSALFGTPFCYAILYHLFGLRLLPGRPFPQRDRPETEEQQTERDRGRRGHGAVTTALGRGIVVVMIVIAGGVAESIVFG